MTQKMFTFTNERISPENRADGRQVVQVTPAGTKILASIVDGEITKYEAEDSEGNYRSVFSVSQFIPPGGHIVDIGGPGSRVGCWVCVDDIDGGAFCYDIECPPFPPPPEIQLP
jgi:hypothetical protein